MSGFSIVFCLPFLLRYLVWYVWNISSIYCYFACLSSGNSVFCINPTVWFIYLVYLIYPTYSPSIFCIASILSLSYLLSLAHVRMTNKWKHTKTLLSLSCINSYNYPYLKPAFGSHVSMWVCLSNNWHSSTPGPMHRPLPQACQRGSAMTKRIGAFAWWRRKTTESE